MQIRMSVTVVTLALRHDGCLSAYQALRCVSQSPFKGFIRDRNAGSWRFDDLAHARAPVGNAARDLNTACIHALHGLRCDDVNGALRRIRRSWHEDDATPVRQFLP